MGGKNAQVGFYYQNLYTILQILQLLKSGKVLSVKIEQNIESGSSKEIDLVIEFEGDNCDFYEIKSGQHFKNSSADIKNTIKKFYVVHNQKNADAQYKYFLIVNPELQAPILEIMLTLQKVIDKRRGHKKIARMLATQCRISQADLLWETLQNTRIRNENDLQKLELLCLAEIRKISEDLVTNADHGMQIRDLLNRLVKYIKDSLINKNGIIDVKEFIEPIIEWSARNRLIARIPQGIDVERTLDEERENVRKKMQTIFPNIVIMRTTPNIITQT